MPDAWTCKNCNTELRCSCQSQECDFEYTIRDHVRRDLVKAVENALLWMEPISIVNITNRTIDDNKEPCCDACAKNNG